MFSVIIYVMYGDISLFVCTTQVCITYILHLSLAIFKFCVFGYIHLKLYQMNHHLFRYMEESGHSSSNGRASHNIGRLGNLVRVTSFGLWLPFFI